MWAVKDLHFCSILAASVLANFNTISRRVRLAERAVWCGVNVGSTGFI